MRDRRVTPKRSLCGIARHMGAGVSLQTVHCSPVPRAFRIGHGRLKRKVVSWQERYKGRHRKTCYRARWQQVPMPVVGTSTALPHARTGQRGSLAIALCVVAHFLEGNNVWVRGTDISRKLLDALVVQSLPWGMETGRSFTSRRCRPRFLAILVGGERCAHLVELIDVPNVVGHDAQPLWVVAGLSPDISKRCNSGADEHGNKGTNRGTGKGSLTRRTMRGGPRPTRGGQCRALRPRSSI